MIILLIIIKKAAINACGVLNERLAPFKQQLGSSATWLQVLLIIINTNKWLFYSLLLIINY